MGLFSKKSQKESVEAKVHEMLVRCCKCEQIDYIESMATLFHVVDCHFCAPYYIHTKCIAGSMWDRRVPGSRWRSRKCN